MENAGEAIVTAQPVPLYVDILRLQHRELSWLQRLRAGGPPRGTAVCVEAQLDLHETFLSGCCNQNKAGQCDRGAVSGWTVVNGLSEKIKFLLKLESR